MKTPEECLDFINRWRYSMNRPSEEEFWAYPARVKYRGFSGEINDKGYYYVSKYLKDNISELLSECDVPEDIDNE